MLTRMILAFLLAWAGGAWAGWLQVINFNSDANVYADPATISNTGNSRVSMQVLHDSTKVETIGSGSSGVSFQSAKYVDEFDCKSGETRNLSAILFSGNMAKGTAVSASDMRKIWTSASDHPTELALWKIACGKQ